MLAFLFYHVFSYVIIMLVFLELHHFEFYNPWYNSLDYIEVQIVYSIDCFIEISKYKSVDSDEYTGLLQMDVLLAVHFISCCINFIDKIPW